VIFDRRRVVRYAKGLLERPAEMRWIDYGLTALRRNVLAERAPHTGPDTSRPPAG
jgi:hypothetical protein